jgi:hypothetical protein
VRRPLACLVALAAGLSLSACGNQVAATPDAQRTHASTAPLAPATTPAWRADPTGKVACSTGRLPARGGQARFEARLGTTTAALSGQVHGSRWLPTLAHPTLTVTTAGSTAAVALRAPRMGPGGPAAYVPGHLGLDGRVSGYVCLAQFDSGPPVALSDSYSGGAHCCTAVQVVDTSGRQSHLRTGNVSPTLRIVDGQLLLASGDDAFSYAFADFADSCAPVSLLRPHDGDFRDVTTEHPQVLRADARRAWRYAQQRTIRTGLLACWAADEDRLGADAKVWQTLNALEQQGKLRLPRDLTRPGWWKDGAAYVAQLRAFLTERGYRTS